MNKYLFGLTGFLSCFSALSSASYAHYTIQDFNYDQVSQASRKDIRHLLATLTESSNPLSLNDKVRIAVMHFTDKPYGMNFADGEGDWQDAHHRGALHIQQAPVYRTDQFVCNTLVQTVLATMQSHTINQFNQNLINNKYGAAGNKAIHYYNRNNFISADFNPVNQASGCIIDKTDSFPHAATHTIINRQRWFKFQQKNSRISANINIIDTGHANINHSNGTKMYQRFMSHYPLPFHRFFPKNVAIDYIPKENLVIYHNGSQEDQKHEAFIQTLPTPSIIEIVRDAKKWNIEGKNIKAVIGTALNISHLGLIYRQDFNRGQVIYNRINCHYHQAQKKVCRVTPVLCSKTSGCSETMYAAATSAYPDGYFYYKDASDHYQCTENKPKAGVQYTSCNRVQSMRLGDYFSSYQYGRYVYMNTPSILGIHIEKIIQ